MAKSSRDPAVRRWGRRTRAQQLVGTNDASSLRSPAFLLPALGAWRRRGIPWFRSRDGTAALHGLSLQRAGMGMFLSLIAGFPSHDNVSSAADSQIHHFTDFFFFPSHLGSSSSSARGLAGGLKDEEQRLLTNISVTSLQTYRVGVPAIEYSGVITTAFPG